MRYVANGVHHEVTLVPMLDVLAKAAPAGAMLARAGGGGPSVDERGTRLVNRLRTVSGIAARFDAPLGETQMVVVTTKTRGAAAEGVLTIATDTVTVEGARLADIVWAEEMFGAQLVEEGEEGKKLLKVPRDANAGLQRAFDLAEQLLQRGVAAAHPNFVRALPHLPLVTASAPTQWAHRMIGVAQVWKKTMGEKIRVAILDEGVDTNHAALKPAVVAQRDFIEANGDNAMPSANDAHGTACAGIVVSRDPACPGVAPKASLIAARIALSDAQGNWIFDDFKTADAVDWCWRTGADVLSNSWGGGPPVDVITRAFERARTLGRNGLGAVVVIAAGNNQGPVQYPATIPGVLAVGASNQFDERKTRTSRDGERWGSCFGPVLALLAPGVRILTTDITGAAGYDPGDFVATFNGTSSATPHVAATAALILSVSPKLQAAQVRQIIIETAKKLAGQTKWTPELGHGRLDAAAAVAAAFAAPPSPTIVGVDTPKARRRSAALSKKVRSRPKGAKKATRQRRR